MCFCLNYDVNYKWEVFDISMFTPPENGVYGLDEGDLIYVLDNQFSSWIEKKQKRELKTISKHELAKWVSCFTQVTECRHQNNPHWLMMLQALLTGWWCYKFHLWLTLTPGKAPMSEVSRAHSCAMSLTTRSVRALLSAPSALCTLRHCTRVVR